MWKGSLMHKLMHTPTLSLNEKDQTQYQLGFLFVCGGLEIEFTKVLKTIEKA